MKRFFKHFSLYYKFYVVVLLAVMIPIIIEYHFFGLNIPSGKHGDWLGFWGNYFGAIIAVFSSLLVLYLQNLINDKNKEKEKIENFKKIKSFTKAKMMKELKLIESKVDHYLNNMEEGKSYAKGINNLIQEFYSKWRDNEFQDYVSDNIPIEGRDGYEEKLEKLKEDLLSFTKLDIEGIYKKGIIETIQKDINNWFDNIDTNVNAIMEIKHIK